MLLLMIRRFQPGRLQVPVSEDRLQWGAALGAGFIAGSTLLLVPRGDPWSALTFFSGVILGRNVPPSAGLPLLIAWAVHLLLSVVYGLAIGRIVAGLKQGWAIVAGGAVGLVLYGLNYVVVSVWFPGLRGREVGVAFTHLVFGLIAAGVYRGLLKRKAMAEIG